MYLITKVEKEYKTSSVTGADIPTGRYIVLVSDTWNPFQSVTIKVPKHTYTEDMFYVGKVVNLPLRYRLKMFFKL